MVAPNGNHPPRADERPNPFDIFRRAARGQDPWEEDDGEETDPFDNPTALDEDMKKNPGSYPELTSLGNRGSTTVRLQRDTGDTEAEMMARYGFSQPIAQISKLTQKPYGYQRDGNITDNLERLAILGSNELSDLILGAPCVNRRARFDAEEERAQQWLRIIKADNRDTDHQKHDRPDLNSLLERWSSADAWMLQALVEGDKYGIDETAHLDSKYEEMEDQRRWVEMRAAELLPAENMFFWCRVTQYKIMREQSYDVAMGYPTADFTEMKRALAGGADIHDLIMEMSWPHKEGFHRVMNSMLSGDPHRNLISSLMAQQQLQQAQPQPPWMQPWTPGGQQPGQPDGEGEKKDERRAIFNFGGGKNNGQQQGGQPEQPKPRKRRRTRRGG